jgi:hypothetical protein
MAPLLRLRIFTCLATVGKGQRAQKSFRFEVNPTVNLEVVLTHFFSAGLGAGMMEAIFAVTPSETIK